MLEYIKEEANRTLTENGAAAHLSTGSDCLDFFASAGALRRESDEEILATVVPALHEQTESTANEAVLPFKVKELPEEYLRQTVPTRGDKLQLLELSLRNVRAYQIQCRHQRALVDPDEAASVRRNDKLFIVTEAEK